MTNTIQLNRRNNIQPLLYTDNQIIILKYEDEPQIAA